MEVVEIDGMRLAFRRVAHEFDRRVRGARLAVVPDCGHVSNLENPQMFNDILRGFLRRHAA